MAQGIDTIDLNRLLLRGIDGTDTENIVKWRLDPNVYKFFKFPHQITAEEHLKWYNTSYLTNENRFDWICIEKKSGKPIGVFGLIKDENSVEVNYLLDPEAQHKGYAFEAIQGLRRYASETWGSKQMVAEIHKNNKPSIILVEKLGFSLICINDPFVVYGVEI